MAHSSKGSVRDESTSGLGVSRDRLSGSEWDSETCEPVDDRDGENINLDIECINERLEKKTRR